jgi:glycosyltransferase involved in cell wall biosynthesis
MLRTAWNVVRAALHEQAQVYHLHDPELLLWTPLLRRSGAVVIFDMHEYMAGSILTKSWLPSRVRSPLAASYRLAERGLLQGVPVIFAEESYRKHFPYLSKTAVVLNMPLHEELIGLDAPRHERFTVGYMGGVSPIRGSIVTIEALQILKEKGLEIPFECVGTVSEQHRQEMERFCREAGLRDCRLSGYQLPTDGWALMARCHAGLAVLQDVPNYRESYPTKMFEYMALGLPIVVSNFPLYRAIVERYQCGFCVDPGDAVAVAAALEWLARHPDQASVMGARGRDAVLTAHNWDNEAKTLLAFYASLT